METCSRAFFLFCFFFGDNQENNNNKQTGNRMDMKKKFFSYPDGHAQSFNQSFYNHVLIDFKFDSSQVN